MVIRKEMEMRILLSFILCLVMASFAFADITVTGKHTVLAKADMVSFVVTVETEDKDVKIALSNNVLSSKRTMLALGHFGVKAENCETLGFSVRPQYQQLLNQPRQLKGYLVNNTFKVTIPKKGRDSLGNIVGKAVVSVISNDVRVSNVGFGVMDDEALREKARVLAIKDAKKKARTLATEAGVSLGMAKSISESTSSSMPGRYYKAAESNSMPIMGGDQRITVTVHITFHIVGESRRLHDDRWN